MTRFAGWRESEIYYLVNHLENNIDLDTISFRLDRTTNSLRHKVARLKESGQYAEYIAGSKEPA